MLRYFYCLCGAGILEDVQEGSQQRTGEALSRLDLVHFRTDLEDRRARLMDEAGRTAQDMAVDADGFPDPPDRGCLESGRNLQLRIRDRERRLLGKIDAALERIEDGPYTEEEAFAKLDEWSAKSS